MVMIRSTKITYSSGLSGLYQNGYVSKWFCLKIECPTPRRSPLQLPFLDVIYSWIDPQPVVLAIHYIYPYDSRISMLYSHYSTSLKTRQIPWFPRSSHCSTPHQILRKMPKNTSKPIPEVRWLTLIFRELSNNGASAQGLAFLPAQSMDLPGEPAEPAEETLGVPFFSVDLNGSKWGRCGDFNDQQVVGIVIY